VLSIDGLNVSIGATPVLRGVTLEVPAASMCGLIGRNGAGKTTLMRAIMGALPTAGGVARFEHHDLARVPAHHRARLGIGYMPEDRRLVPALTAEENIMLPVWSTGMDDPEDRLEWIYGLMPEVAEFRRRGATQLSGGQQKFVAFARALMVGTQLLLLDEPNEGIAPVFARRMVEILANLKAEGHAVLVAESNDAHIGDLLDHVFVLERGQVIESRSAA
jgi:branched-chain amino acid transport system ATP-binding protein